MRVEFSKRFIKELRRAPRNIQNAFITRMELFKNNPYHSLLNNHGLTGKLNGCRSININGDWRALYEDLENGEFCSFFTIGTHSQLY